ncbi:MAG: helix-turn-helix domain-containing protein [Desulfococcaceae bacterium]
MTEAKPETDETPWLTVKEAADRLRLKPGTLRNYMTRKLIPYHRNPHTGTVRLRRDEVDAWLTQGTVMGPGH